MDNYAYTRYCMTDDRKSMVSTVLFSMGQFLAGRMMNQMFGDYQLREAAGSYWLIDMKQAGKEWRQPLRLNETGALLLKGVYEGRTPEKLAEELAACYGLPLEEMKEDVDAFLAQLDANGIDFK